jgi:hypothetical protein
MIFKHFIPISVAVATDFSIPLYYNQTVLQSKETLRAKKLKRRAALNSGAQQ